MPRPHALDPGCKIRVCRMLSPFGSTPHWKEVAFETDYYHTLEAKNSARTSRLLICNQVHKSHCEQCLQCKQSRHGPPDLSARRLDEGGTFRSNAERRFRYYPVPRSLFDSYSAGGLCGLRYRKRSGYQSSRAMHSVAATPSRDANTMLDVLTTALSQSAKRNHDEPLTSSIRNVCQKLPMAVPAATTPPQESNVQTPEQEPIGRDAVLTCTPKSKAVFVMTQRRGGFAVAMAPKAKQPTPWLATSDRRDYSSHTMKLVAKELGDFLCAASYQKPAIAPDMVMSMLYRNANYPVLEMVRTRLAEDTYAVTKTRLGHCGWPLCFCTASSNSQAHRQGTSGSQCRVCGSCISFQSTCETYWHFSRDSCYLEIPGPADATRQCAV